MDMNLRSAKYNEPPHPTSGMSHWVIWDESSGMSVPGHCLRVPTLLLTPPGKYFLKHKVMIIFVQSDLI